MLSSSLDALLKLSKTTSAQKLFDYDCVTLWIYINIQGAIAFQDIVSGSYKQYVTLT